MSTVNLAQSRFNVEIFPIVVDGWGGRDGRKDGSAHVCHKKAGM
jgi:hypothetical protein